MVIDTSAIVAIALNEADAAEFEERIADDPIRLISAATVLRATISRSIAGAQPTRRLPHGTAALAAGECGTRSFALPRRARQHCKQS
jgi:hypothetical protein